MTSIAASFLKLSADLTAPDSLSDVVDSHVEAIRNRLSKAFTLVKLVKVGSFSRGTFVAGSSDVDALAVISRNDARWGTAYVSSNTVLNQFRDELAARFRNTQVRRDVQAVVVEFTDCSVDVVPAFFLGPADNGWPLYAMPDGNGNWMKTCPEWHNAYIRKADIAARGKLRGTARLMKFWRECRTPRVPLSSFHIEIVLASEQLCLGAKSYAVCVTQTLHRLAQRECRSIRDPEGISGTIPAVRTELQRGFALAAVRYARDHAVAALDAESKGEIVEARRQWNIVFKRCFPG